jgi:hypothetical protein
MVLCAHLNELNAKLRGIWKHIDFMFSVIAEFEKKLKLYECDLSIRTLKYCLRMNNYLNDIKILEDP